MKFQYSKENVNAKFNILIQIKAWKPQSDFAFMNMDWKSISQGWSDAAWSTLDSNKIEPNKASTQSNWCLIRGSTKKEYFWHEHWVTTLKN
jgi:hypothetical protein